MDTNFSYFTFSIFRGCSFNDFTEAVKNNVFYGRLLNQQKAILEHASHNCIDKYKDPSMGRVLEQFSWWQSRLYPDFVFLSSNRVDGLQTGCYSIQKYLKCDCINWSISNGDIPYPKNHFEFIGADGKERVVIAIKEEKWSFYEDGTPLLFEDVEFYKARRVRDRLNIDIITMYLKRLGVEFHKIDSMVSNCMTFTRTEW